VGGYLCSRFFGAAVEAAFFGTAFFAAFLFGPCFGRAAAREEKSAGAASIAEALKREGKRKVLV
jgi:hypothetical protein